MSIRKISELPTSTSAVDSALLMVVQNSETQKITKNDFLYGHKCRNITNANNGDTLGTDYDDYFIENPYSYVTLNLPSPSEMIGRELTFVVTSGGYEGQTLIYGSFNGSDHMTLVSTNSAAKIISNGTNWYITSWND